MEEKKLSAERNKREKFIIERRTPKLGYVHRTENNRTFSVAEIRIHAHTNNTGNTHQTHAYNQFRECARSLVFSVDRYAS